MKGNSEMYNPNRRMKIRWTLSYNADSGRSISPLTMIAKEQMKCTCTAQLDYWRYALKNISVYNSFRKKQTVPTVKRNEMYNPME